LLGDGFDHIQDTADFIALFLEVAHSVCRLVEFCRQALDLLDGFTHDLLALAGLLIGGRRSDEASSALRATLWTVAVISFIAVAT